MQQHHDHIWINWDGKGWAIRAIRYPIIYLWRGYWPDLEYFAIDVSDIDWAAYCEAAVSLLKEKGND